MDYVDSIEVMQEKDARKYGNKGEYIADKCPSFGSPDFLKKFPIDMTTEEGFRRAMAAQANGYGD